MRRWTRRIVWGLIIVIAVVLIAVQVILWTDYPRRLVLQLVQQQLGLRVEANSLSTGWLGNTTLRDVRLSLPLAQESFLDMPQLRVSHTALLPLLITQKFELQSLTLDTPTLVAQRDANGRWNLEDVAVLIARAGGGTPAPGTKKRPPTLPRLRVSDGAIVIIEKNGERAMIKPLTVTGTPDGSLVYRYDATVPNDQLKAVGQIAPGEDFKHEVQFVLQPREWLTPWMKNAPTPLRLDGRWAGVVKDGIVTGRLIVEDAKLESYGARGRMAVQTGRGQTILNPQDFTVTTPIELAPTIHLASGTVQVNGTALTVQQLRVGTLGGQVQLDGTGDLAARTADLFGTWRELVSPGQMTHGGNLHLTVKNASPGRPEVTGEIVSRGQVRRGSWDGQITLQGSGRSFEEMDWTVKVPRVTWEGKLPWEIEDITMSITQRDSKLTLTQLRWPAAQLLTAYAEYDIPNKKWLARVRGRGVLHERPSGIETPLPFDFNLDGYGDPTRVHLNELFVHARGGRVRVTGDYVKDLPNPVALSVYVTHVPSDVVSQDDLPIQGRFHSEGHLSGKLKPDVALDFSGVVRSEDLVISKRPFGEVRGKITGNYNGDVARFDVENLALLGGQWTVKGAWPYEEKDRQLEGSPLHVIVGVDQLSLKDVGELLKVDGLKGSANANWTIDITKFKRDLLAMSGSFKASSVAFQKLDADEVTGEMNLKNGTLHVDPIRLRKGEKGSATATIETTLAEARKPQVTLNVVEWPVPISPTSTAALWGDTQLVIDARNKGAAGTVKARLVTQPPTTEAEMTVTGKVNGRTLSLDQIDFKGIDGSATGRLFVNADEPDDTNGVLTWTGLHGERIAELVPKLEGLTGSYGGAITIEPSTSQRALEPTRVRLDLSPDNGKFRTLKIGPVKLSAFVALDTKFGLQRIVLDELPSEDREEHRREAELDEKNVSPTSRPLGWNDIRLADGRIKLWARRGAHVGGEITTHFIVNFERLDLNEIVHTFKADADPMPGRLGGEIVMHGSAGNPDAILADGRMRITESDLGNVDALALLYDVLSLGSSKTPIGTGKLDLRIQRSTLTLNNVYYFNRGAEAWSSDIVINDVWQIPRSPIQGYVVGSARPLSALKLPFLADVDQILSVLQSNLTTVHMTGTVANPVVKTTTFSDVGSGLKQFLSGEVNKAKK